MSAATKRQPKRAAKRVPPLWTSDTGITINGRRDLRAVYPSTTSTANHTCSGTDDGRITACTCDGWQFTGKCWHADCLVDDFWRARWGTETLAALQWRTRELLHWLALGPDEADENCARIELSTLGDLFAERLAESEAA